MQLALSALGIRPSTLNSYLRKCRGNPALPTGLLVHVVSFVVHVRPELTKIEHVSMPHFAGVMTMTEREYFQLMFGGVMTMTEQTSDNIVAPDTRLIQQLLNRCWTICYQTWWRWTLHLATHSKLCNLRGNTKCPDWKLFVTVYKQLIVVDDMSPQSSVQLLEADTNR